jgi:hypothetical protein
MPCSKSREQLAVDLDVNGRGHAASGRGAIGSAEQSRDDLARLLAAGDGDPLEALGILAVKVDDDPYLRVRVRREALDQLRIEILELSVEVAGLRIVGGPG